MHAVTFHAGGAWVVLDDGSDGQSMRIVDIETGWQCCRLSPHAEGVRQAVFSPDGTRLATIDRDGAGRVFNLVAALREFPSVGPTGPRQPLFRRPGTGPVVYRIEGARIADWAGFWTEIGTAVNGPGGYFGGGLDSLNDCLRGGFGTPEDGDFLFVWVDHELSRDRLGYPETCRQLEHRIARCHPSNVPKAQAELDQARAGRGPTAFDWIISVFTDHHPGRLVLE